MESVVERYKTYQEYKEELDSELSKTAEGFVRIGYLLRLAEDTDILKESGYSSVLEFAQAEYNIDKTQVSRFININKKFSESGYSDRLREEYRGFGYSKLTIMMQLPDTVNEELTPEYSKSEIQQIKNQIDEENKTTDLEIMMEGQDPVMEAAEDDLCRAVRQLAGDIQDGEEIPRLYKEIWTAGRTGLTAEDLQVIMTPAGQRMYTMRIQGMGGQNLSLKDHNNGDSVALINMRTGEKQEYTWNRLLEVWRYLISGGTTYQEAWQQLYGKPWPEEKKIAPVQPKEEKKPAPRKETKVSQPKKPEPVKASEKPAEPVEEQRQQAPAIPQSKWPSTYKPGDIVMNTLSTECGELVEQTAKEKIWLFRPTAPAGDPYNLSEDYFKTGQAPEEPETQVNDSSSEKTDASDQNTEAMVTEEQVPGQTDLENDFPQYCPDEGDKRAAYRQSIRGSVENLVRYVEMDLIAAARQQLSDISGYLDKLEELSKGGRAGCRRCRNRRERGSLTPPPVRSSRSGICISASFVGWNITWRMLPGTVNNCRASCTTSRDPAAVSESHRTVRWAARATTRCWTMATRAGGRRCCRCLSSTCRITTRTGRRML